MSDFIGTLRSRANIDAAGPRPTTRRRARHRALGRAARRRNGDRRHLKRRPLPIPRGKQSAYGRFLSGVGTMTWMPDAGERNAAQKVATGDEPSEDDMNIKRVRQIATLGIVGVALTATPLIATSGPAAARTSSCQQV